MQLDFEIQKEVVSGSYNYLMHFWDNQVQLFYIKNGEIYSKIGKLELGDWDKVEWVRERKLFENITDVVELQVLSVYQNLIVGIYRRTDNKVYMFDYEY